MSWRAGPKRAVLIGVSDYSAESGLAPLPSVRTTIEDMGRALTFCDYKSSNITPMINPSLDQIANQIDLVTQKPSEVLLIYYAGHGVPSDGGELHLALTRSSDSRSTLLGWMPYGAVHQALEAARQRGDTPAIVVILDCCHAGLAMGLRSSTPLSIRDEDCTDGGLVLAACSPASEAIAPANSRHTVLGGGLIKLILSGDSRLDDPILWGDAASILAKDLLPRPSAFWLGDGAKLFFSQNRSGRPVSERSLASRPRASGPSIMKAAVAASLATGVLGSLLEVAEDWLDEYLG